MSFENLAIEDAQLPDVERKRDNSPNPFLDALAQSYQTDKGKAVTIPAEMGTEAVKKIRQGAEKLDIGVRVVCTLKSNGERCDYKKLAELRDKKSKAQLTIMFQGKTKRKRVSKKKETAVETPAVENSATVAPDAGTPAE
jgi:hypothetical protein